MSMVKKLLRPPSPTYQAAEIVKLDPELAGALLELNTANRHLSPTALAKYIRMQQQGFWRLTADGIGLTYNKKTRNWQMANGQHRCEMVVHTGEPIMVVLVYGVDEDSRPVADTGRRMSVGDALVIGGHKHQAETSKALSCAWRWEKGIEWQNDGPTNPEALAILKARPRLPDSYLSTATAGRITNTSVGSLMWIHHHLVVDLGVSMELVDTFFNRLADGDRLAADNPIAVVRNYLLRAAQQSARERKVSPQFKQAKVVLAWNAWVGGEPLKSNLQPSGKYPQLHEVITKPR